MLYPLEFQMAGAAEADVRTWMDEGEHWNLLLDELLLKEQEWAETQRQSSSVSELKFTVLLNI